MFRLSNDLLLYLFSFCDAQSLVTLSQVCKLFHQLSKHEFVWKQNGQSCFITNQVSSEIRARSCYLLKAKDKCRISLNWTKQRCKTYPVLRHRKNYMPWIQLRSDRLWISQGKCIYGYKHLKSGYIDMKPRVEFSTAPEDVCRFALKDNLLVTGGSVGSINAWSVDTEQLICSINSCHREEINSIDCQVGTVVSGSRDKSVKVWQLNESQLTETLKIDLRERVWSVAIDPSGGGSFACGSSGNSSNPLCIYDLQKGLMISKLKDDFVPGSGIFHIIYENPNSILTCGFDTIIRLWDTRTMQRVIKWINPFDMSVLCLSSDQNFSFVSGSGSHCLVCLWDKRKHSQVQEIYADRSGSPVYSIAFDPCHLYVSLDKSLKLIDFS